MAALSPVPMTRAASNESFAMLAQHVSGERDAGELSRQAGTVERDVPDDLPANCDVLTVPERPAAVTRIRDGHGRGDRDGTRCQRPGARPDMQQEKSRCP